MDQLHLLLSLPVGLCSEILTLWLPIPDRVRLDSAHCNHSQREALLALFRTPECAVTSWELHRGTTNSIIAWANVRNVVVEKIALNSQSDLDVFESYLRNFGSHVTHIKAYGTLAKALTSIHCCPNLLRLELTMCEVSPTLRDVLTHCSRLKEFSCVFHSHSRSTLPADTLSAADLDGIQCPNLRLLSLVRCGDPAAVAALVRSAVQVETLLLYNCDSEGTLHADIVSSISPTVTIISLTQLQVCPEAEFCAMVARCSGLLHLDLSGTSVTPDMARAVGSQLKLQSLGLSYAEITDEVLLRLVQCMSPTLTELMLGRVSVQVMHSVLLSATLLHTFHAQCEDDSSYRMDWSILHSLRSLSVTYVGYQQNHFLAQIALHCSALQHLQLNLSKMDFQIASVDTIIQKCTHLRTICVDVINRDVFYGAENEARWQQMNSQLVVHHDFTAILTVLQALL